MKKKLHSLDWQQILFGLFFFVFTFNILWPKVPLIQLEGLGTPIRIEDLLYVGLTLLFITALLLGKIKRVRSPMDEIVIVFLWVGFLATMFGALALHSTALGAGLLHFLRRIQYLSFFYFAYYLLDTLPHLRRLITSFLHLGILVSLIGYLQILNLFPLHVPSNHPTQQYVFFHQLKFVNSTFGGHYDLASFYLILFSICFALLIFLFYRSYWVILSGTVILLAAVPFYLTFGRSALLGTLAGVAVLLFIKNKKLLVLPVVLGVLAMFLFFGGKLSRYKDIKLTHGLEEPRVTAQGRLPFGASYKVTQSSTLTILTFDYRGKTYEMKDPSIGPRVARWPLATQKFTKHPLFGAGYGTIGEGYDGDYVRMIAEVGIFGVLAFFGLVFIIGRQSWRLFVECGDRVVGAFGLGVMAATTGLLLNAVFIDVFEASKVAITFWSLAGFSLKGLWLCRQSSVSSAEAST